ncbi:unnamed protein product [Phytomonas sp. EM1]|nr:unnamed protein product [Phytomonas sp. EM1]|eukprot:CCW62101.1 unnamed protein product [Phytomonas sp. isolate EM1]
MSFVDNGEGLLRIARSPQLSPEAAQVFNPETTPSAVRKEVAEEIRSNADEGNVGLQGDKEKGSSNSQSVMIHVGAAQNSNTPVETNRPEAHLLETGAKCGSRKRALGNFRKVGCLFCTKDAWHAYILAFMALLEGIVIILFVPPSGELLSYFVIGLLLIGSLVCLLLSVWLDPGIVPPAPATATPKAPEIRTINGTKVLCKICPTCHIIRPPRSTHCQFCDVCMEEFDHHCGFIGSCVAKRTYRFFAGFFILRSCMVIYTIIRSFLRLFTSKRKDSLAADCNSWIVIILCLIVSLTEATCVLPMSFIYIKMALLKTTQKESARGPSGVCVRNHPYSKNLCYDCLKRFFGPLGRSYIESDYYV